MSSSKSSRTSSPSSSSSSAAAAAAAPSSQSPTPKRSKVSQSAKARYAERRKLYRQEVQQEFDQLALLCGVTTEEQLEAVLKAERVVGKKASKRKRAALAHTRPFTQTDVLASATSMLRDLSNEYDELMRRHRQLQERGREAAAVGSTATESSSSTSATARHVPAAVPLVAAHVMSVAPPSTTVRDSHLRLQALDERARSIDTQLRVIRQQLGSSSSSSASAAADGGWEFDMSVPHDGEHRQLLAALAQPAYADPSMSAAASLRRAHQSLQALGGELVDVRDEDNGDDDVPMFPAVSQAEMAANAVVDSLWRDADGNEVDPPALTGPVLPYSTDLISLNDVPRSALDASGLVISMNAACGSLLGGRPQDFIGLTCFVMTDAEDLARTAIVLSNLFSTGQPEQLLSIRSAPDANGRVLCVNIFLEIQDGIVYTRIIKLSELHVSNLVPRLGPWMPPGVRSPVPLLKLGEDGALTQVHGEDD